MDNTYNDITIIRRVVGKTLFFMWGFIDATFEIVLSKVLNRTVTMGAIEIHRESWQ